MATCTMIAEMKIRRFCATLLIIASLTRWDWLAKKCFKFEVKPAKE